METRNSKKSASPIFIIMLALGLASGLSCNRDHLLRQNAEAVTLLISALGAADQAYRAGFIRAEDERRILLTGDELRRALVEINNYASTLAPGQLPSAEKKRLALDALDAAIAHANNLVAAGVLVTDPKSRDSFYRYIRPAQVAILAIRAAIVATQTAKASPPPTPSAVIPKQSVRAPAVRAPLAPRPSGRWPRCLNS